MSLVYTRIHERNYTTVGRNLLLEIYNFVVHDGTPLNSLSNLSTTEICHLKVANFFHNWLGRLALFSSELILKKSICYYPLETIMWRKYFIKIICILSTLTCRASIEWLVAFLHTWVVWSAAIGLEFSYLYWISEGYFPLSRHLNANFLVPNMPRYLLLITLNYNKLLITPLN